jgi:hypothetical protein
MLLTELARQLAVTNLDQDALSYLGRQESASHRDQVNEEMVIENDNFDDPYDGDAECYVTNEDAQSGNDCPVMEEEECQCTGWYDSYEY